MSHHALADIPCAYIRLELEEERDTLKAKCLRSQSSIAELRTRLQHEKNGIFMCNCGVYTAHVYHIIHFIAYDCIVLPNSTVVLVVLRP